MDKYYEEITLAHFAEIRNSFVPDYIDRYELLKAVRKIPRAYADALDISDVEHAILSAPRKGIYFKSE